MVRKSDQTHNKAGNAAVAAVQQAHHQASAQNVKANMMAQKPAAAAQKQSTTMAAAIQQHAAKPQQKIAMAPAPQQQSQKPQAKSQTMRASYEIFMAPSMFQEPATWTQNQAPCHVPHVLRQAKKQASKKEIIAQPEPTVINHKKPMNKSGSKTKMQQKSATNFNSAAGKQLILRPTGAIILYRPLWMQVRHWAIRMAHESEGRGRSAKMNTKAQKIQQQKDRIMEQRKHTDVRKSQQHAPAPKQQANARIQQTKKEMQSAPKAWQANIWEDFYTSKHASLAEATKVKETEKIVPAPFKPSKSFTKNRQAVGKSLKSTVPPPLEAKTSEIFSFLHDGPGVYSPAPQQQIPPPKNTMRRQEPGVSNSSPVGNTPDIWADFVDRPARPMMAPQPQQQPAPTGNAAWFSPQNIAIASAFVAMGGMGISKIFAA